MVEKPIFVLMIPIPVKEETEYVDSIKEDINWLGFNWAKNYMLSDYFDKLYEFAVKLINKGWPM